MKKLLLLTLAFTVLGSSAIKAEAIQTQPQDSTQITFIYINGSNDKSAKNRYKFGENFERDVKKMHPIMAERLSKDEFVQTQLLKNGQYVINPEPVMFYWGEKSLQNVQAIDEGLNLISKLTPKIAQKARGLFAHCLHDAVWIQKHQHMAPAIDELHTLVKAETDKGNKVVLLGYSAGSFVTYNYFLNKFISVEPQNIIERATDKELAKLVEENPMQPTCIDALIESEVVTLDAYGEYSTNKDKEKLHTNYPKLDDYTNKVCFARSDIKGVINFASPLIVFYSDITDTKTSMNYLSQLMLKHMIENDVFFVTVNFRNDPFGFSVGKNPNFTDLVKSNETLFAKAEPNGGFIYSKSDVFIPRSVLAAHLAYWSSPKRFVKGVVRAYNDGYANFYAK